MLKEFIEKSIETDSGFPAGCWVITGIWLDIKANVGVITLEGYKDFEAKEAGKQVMGTRKVSIPDLSLMDCYDDVKTAVVGATFTSAEFANATLQTRDVPEEQNTIGDNDNDS
jgi:hypothetical protein